MGLFDRFKSSNNDTNLSKEDRNFAKEFKDSVEKSYNTQQLNLKEQSEIITSWQSLPDYEDDANFWFAHIIFTSQVAILSGDKTSDTLESVTKGLFVALTKKPKDSSLAEWYKKNAKDASDTLKII